MAASMLQRWRKEQGHRGGPGSAIVCRNGTDLPAAAQHRRCVRVAPAVQTRAERVAAPHPVTSRNGPASASSHAGAMSQTMRLA